MREDHQMDRFERNARRFSARDAITAVLVCALALIAVQGAAISRAANRMGAGVEHDLLSAIGRPSGWIADHLPFHAPVARIIRPLSPDRRLATGGGFGAPARFEAAGAAIPPVTPDAFTPSDVGSRPARPRPFHKLLVTGDSLSTPLDIELGRRLAVKDVRVMREPHLGTGISKTALVDWDKLSRTQMAQDEPDAVVVFIGANEGFPMVGPGGRQVTCCDARWAAVYATRVRQMMNVYRASGRTRVVWITVPTPRDAARRRIARTVNAAVKVAAQPWRDQVVVLDSVGIFTPGMQYRDAMPVGGHDVIVREADGIHLNRVGAGLLADVVVRTLLQNVRP